jgi:hypothetical protein
VNESPLQSLIVENLFLTGSGDESKKTIDVRPEAERDYELT